MQSAEARGNLLLSAEHTSYSCDIGDDGHPCDPGPPRHAAALVTRKQAFRASTRRDGSALP